MRGSLLRIRVFCGPGVAIIIWNFFILCETKKNKDYLCSVLRKVGLDPALKRPVGKYSLGMRQRLALAQAIMEDPGILILDEL